MVTKIVLIAIAGAAGTLARYWLGGLAQKLTGRSVSQSSTKKGLFIDNLNIGGDELNSFLDAPMKGRKFILNL